VSSVAVVVLRAGSRSSHPMAAPAPAQAQRSILAPGPERYVTRRELAAIMSVSIDTVDRLRGEGMPSVTWGRRTRRFRASIAVAWAASRQSTR
jgi:hypothetical protein